MTPHLDDRDGFIWMDGAMHPWREAKIHVLTHGLHYATAVFEGERAYNGKIFRSRDHSARLLESGRLVHMEIPFSIEALEQAKYDVLRANALQDCYVRAIAWRGSEALGIDISNTKVHVSIAAWEWGSYFDPAIREKGIAIKTTQWRKPHPDTAPIHSKASSLYNLGCMVKHECKIAGFQDALMLDYEGYVAEATGANLFAVKDGKIITPIADRFLNGITRQTVIELARKAGYDVTERRIKPEELQGAQEIFLTGTAAELTPVGRIDDKTYTVGPVTKRLIKNYIDLVNG